MIKLSELAQPVYYQPAALGAAAGFGLLLAGWWLPAGRRSAGLVLLLFLLGWVMGHILVDATSYTFKPAQAANWLVFGALGVAVPAIVAWLRRSGTGAVSIVAGILLAVASWLALQKVPWFFSRAETAQEKWLWTSGIISAALLNFGSAEAASRTIPAARLLCGLGVYALSAGAALFILSMQDKDVARLLAAGTFCTGAAIAGLFHALRKKAPGELPPGAAGWFAGAAFLLFILACFGSVSGVSAALLGAAAAIWPLGAALLYLPARPSPARSLLFLPLLVCGAVALPVLAGFYRNQPPPPASSTPSTGADDTGAYDD